MNYCDNVALISLSFLAIGAGYDLLVKMLRYVSPTHVVQIRVSAESKNLPRGTFWLDENETGSAVPIEICTAPKDSDTPLLVFMLPY